MCRDTMVENHWCRHMTDIDNFMVPPQKSNKFQLFSQKLCTICKQIITKRRLQLNLFAKTSQVAVVDSLTLFIGIFMLLSLKVGPKNTGRCK
jgi:hypothetical protein